MPVWLTTRVKVLLVLVGLAFALVLWDTTTRRAAGPPTTPGGPTAPSPRGLAQRPAAVQQLLAPESKVPPQPRLSPEALRGLQERSRGPWGRDPFALEAARPKGEAEVRTSFAAGLHVSGIVWDTARVHAVINDSVVRVGNEVNGIRIVAIEPDRVTVAKGDQRQVIRLGE